MPRRPAASTRAGRRSAIVATVVLSAVAISVPPATAALGAPVPAAVSITVSDSVEQVKSGLDVSYTTKLVNAGTTTLTGLLVLTVPTYAKVTAPHGGRTSQQDLTWRVTVPARATATRIAGVHLGSITAGQSRVTTLASFYQGTRVTQVPLVRTADADRIAGVKDPVPPSRTARAGAGTTQPAAGRHHDNGGTNLWLAVGLPVAVVLLLLAAGALWWRRRRDAAPADASPVADDPDAPAADAVPAGGTRRRAASEGRHSAK